MNGFCLSSYKIFLIMQNVFIRMDLHLSSCKLFLCMQNAFVRVDTICKNVFLAMETVFPIMQNVKCVFLTMKTVFAIMQNVFLSIIMKNDFVSIENAFFIIKKCQFCPVWNTILTVRGGGLPTKYV